jgi:pimeloyl-ACP methyl ester carboxylesterase
MAKHATGTREQWLAARLELLEAEKELTRRSDELARQRQDLPWVRVNKEYRFETDEGSSSLADLMPSVALSDSPMGTAAWIAEKFWAWSDNNGDLDKTFSKDELLTNIMLYLLSDSGVEGSFRFYRAIRDELRWAFVPGRIEVPTSVALFPREYPMGRPPLQTAKRWYNIVRYTPMPRGGHFAALEQPDLFVNDLRESFRSAR